MILSQLFGLVPPRADTMEQSAAALEEEEPGKTKDTFLAMSLARTYIHFKTIHIDSTLFQVSRLQELSIISCLGQVFVVTL
jgi:hypothetical protein